VRTLAARVRVFVAACAVLALAAAGRAEEDAAARAFVETVATPEDCYVHQVVRLRLRVGVDAAWFEDHVVAAHRREVDLPVHVTAPLDGLPLRVLPRDAGAEDAARRVALVLGEAVVAATRGADVVRGGRTWTVAEFETSVLPESAGEVVVPAPQLSFVWGSEVTDDIVSGRIASDPRTTTVAGAPVTLRVRPLPEEGRPAGFSGAVGRFTVRAAAASREVAVGASVRVALTIEGEGNLSAFETPRLGDVPGFDVLGALDDRGADRRTITYDLAPRAADVASVPPLPFSFFEPGPAPAYRTVRTEALPITVRSHAEATDGTATPSSGAAPVQEFDLWSKLVEFVEVIAAALALLVAIKVYSRSRTRAAERRAAVEAFRTRTAAPGADLADALAEFLAARLACPAASVITPDLAQRLTAAGVAEDVALRAAALLERLVAARYGGGPAPDGAVREAQQIVDALDAAPPRRAVEG
jgi:hypothetical protein